MCWACSMHETKKEYMKVLVHKPEKTDLLEEVGADGKIIVEWVWIGFI